MADYSSQAHWDKECMDIEWHCSYNTLQPLLRPLLNKKRCSVLICGSGASSFPEELYDGGVSDVVVVDFSQVAVDELRARNSDGRTGMRVMQADLGTGLDIPERQVGFDLVVDKGTIDCILSQDGGFPRAVNAVNAIYSHMKTPATFIVVSHSPLADRSDLFRSVYWHDIKVQVVRPPTLENLVSTNQFEEALEDVPEGNDMPYTPGVAYVYSLVK